MIWLFACSKGPPPPPSTSGEAPPEACVKGFSTDRVASLLAGLAELEAAGEYWPGWKPSDNVTVLVHERCAAVWDGGLVDWVELDEDVVWMTPMFAYLLPEDLEGPDFLEATRQPAAVRTALDREQAVLIPTRSDHWLIRLVVNDTNHLQVAVHEGFHVAVQAPLWAGGEGLWPAWDQQPDRDGLGACYARVASEQEALVRMVEDMLGGGTGCLAGREFLSARWSRHLALEGTTVTPADGSEGSCWTAEALMELEEGTADYASWVPLHDLGLATDEQLLSRFGATTDEPFYQLGSAQLFAMKRWHGADGFLELARAQAASASVEEGAIDRLFAQTLEERCRR